MSPAKQRTGAGKLVYGGSGHLMGCPGRCLWVMGGGCSRHQLCRPQLRSRRSGTLETHHLSGHPLGFQRETQLHLSVSTNSFIHFPGNRGRSWEPQSPAAWDAAEGAAGQSEDSEGPGSPVKSLPFLILPDQQGAEQVIRQRLHSPTPSTNIYVPSTRKCQAQEEEGAWMSWGRARKTFHHDPE